jgi:release factor glutamine methyltransferase
MTRLMKIKSLFADYAADLYAIYSKQEAENLVFWMFEHYLGCERRDVHQEKEIDEIPQALMDAMDRLRTGIPIQYIMQSAPFYGREFKVNPAVLIPRNETEELVHLIIQENKDAGLNILDVGTGSGCISITLALEMDRPNILAVDISRDALDLAQSNASIHHTAINYLQLDALEQDFPTNNLDIIVSNPPYVRESEKEKMHKNVLDHEPHLALFVTDHDPLVFYRKIAQKGKNCLKVKGKLYFEINEALGQQVQEMLLTLGYTDIRLLKDLNNKDRLITAVNP